MNERKSKAEARNEQVAAQQAAKAERLAKALRENLGKRKAQGRARQADDSDTGQMTPAKGQGKDE